ncbi:MAG: cytochrome c biogenesis protein CcsA, partial [Thermodesulfobacteriota bacterium]|nr:cytochrome c biogenesis protein CcsA [Thermodesulfobacteriota bacterium]
MNSSYLLSIVTFVYGLAAFLYIVSWVFKKQLPGRIATWIAIIGVVGNTWGIALRWIESYRLGIGHAPLSNMYESLVFFAWTIIIIYLVIEHRYKHRITGVLATPLAFMAMAYASLSPNISDRIQPLIPALKSNWLIAHVITCFLGYAGFAIAFGVSIMYFLKAKKRKSHIFLFLSIVIVICIIIWNLIGEP